jgi:hypothetical protein
MLFHDAPIKNARAYWPFCKVSRKLSAASHQNGGFAAMPY